MHEHKDQECGQEGQPDIWGFPKIRGTFLGVPILRSIVFWGLCGGPLILGKYHLETMKKVALSPRP